MSKLLILIGLVVLLNVFYFGFYRYPQEVFSKKISYEVYQKLIDVMHDNYSNIKIVPEINTEDGRRSRSDYGIWGDYIFSNERVKSTVDKNGTKITFTNFRLLLLSTKSNESSELDISDVSFCTYTFSSREKLFCLNKFLKLKYFDTDLNGHRVKELDHLWGSIIDIIPENENEIWLIWRDERARWYTTNAFVIMGVGAGETRAGPWLVMAGKLNLDTLEFEEYVIKYDSDVFP